MEEKRIIIQNNNDMTEEYSEAVQLHQRIMANGEVLSRSLFEICKDLKEMRDRKLYEEFGYSSFDEYSENAVGLKARMAYNYISTYERLGASVLQSNAHLGITKLELLAGMNPQERAEKLESGELEGMSVAEIKELVKKSKDQGEQISMLQMELAKKEQEEMVASEPDESEELQALKEQVESLQAEISKKEGEIASVKKETAEKIKTLKNEPDPDLQKKIDAAVNKAKKEAKAEASEEAKAEAESTAEKIKTLQDLLSAAGQEKESLEKKLALSDTTSAKAMVYLDAVQKNLNSILELISKMDMEKAEKFKKAADRVLHEFHKRFV